MNFKVLPSQRLGDSDAAPFVFFKDTEEARIVCREEPVNVKISRCSRAGDVTSGGRCGKARNETCQRVGPSLRERLLLWNQLEHLLGQDDMSVFEAVVRVWGEFRARRVVGDLSRGRPLTSVRVDDAGVSWRLTCWRHHHAPVGKVFAGSGLFTRSHVGG